jgi:cell division protein ZipA
MPELRWILIAFGLALLIGIYVWGRRSSKATESANDGVFRPHTESSAADVVLRDEPRFEDTGPRFDIEPDDDSVPDEQLVAQDAAYEASPDGDRESEGFPVETPPTRSDRGRRFARIEPTFTDESATAELPVREQDHDHDVDVQPRIAASSAAAPADAPTLSMSNTPQPRRIERRKIVALRLAAGAQRIHGSELREALEAESLQHGKYAVFHRLEEGGASIFSVASMVEPGTFDLEKMSQESFPGITLFAQFPGPTSGMLAFNELVACSRRLNAALGGTLQDERGVPLTVHRIERIRQDIREFEQRPTEPVSRSTSSYSPSP